jgi:excisionase family DNA binding protein
MSLVKKTGRLLTVMEVAKILRLHPNTIYRLMKRGEIPAFKIGQSWRISGAAVDAWMTGDHTTAPPPSRH